VLAAAAVEAAAKKAAQAADAASAAKGLNDNAHGIDRFGYRVPQINPLSKASPTVIAPLPCAASNPHPTPYPSTF
jgi:hypothetical protein